MIKFIFNIAVIKIFMEGGCIEKYKSALCNFFITAFSVA